MKTQLDHKTILYHLKEIEYIFVRGEIWGSWWKDVIGWNCFTDSSRFRKDIHLEKLKEDIEQMNLPLVIKDKDEFTNAFQVYIV